MVSSVQLSIQDILPRVKELVAEGKNDNQIMQIIRDEHGVGYGGMVTRAIKQVRVSFDVV